MSSRVQQVLVVDDHPIVREGVAQLLAQQLDLRVCGDAVDIESARRAVKLHHPDVALVDLSLGRESGLELIRILVEEAPQLPLLVLSMHDEELYARRVLQLGARGYIMKHEGTQKLLQAIRTVLAGEIYVSARINATFLRALTPKKGTPVVSGSVLHELSNRELQVYRLMGQGLSTKEIAHQLCLSAKTIETHRAHIKHKLGLDSSAAIVAHAAEWLFRGAPEKSADDADAPTPTDAHA